MTDQNGTSHQYEYDKLGALLSDSVTSFGAGVDDTIGRLEFRYNVRRLQVRASSINALTNAVENEVKWEYNDFNQIISEWQEHNGAVTSTSPKVQYLYADGSTNTLRSTGIINPDGTTVSTLYHSAQSSALSRPDKITQSSSTIVSWKYLGLGTVVSRTYEAASATEFTLGTAAAGYPGIDRFGRLAETRWKNGTTDLIHTQYGRNRASGIVWQHNVLAHAMTVPIEDNYYWYDGLHQVTRHDRGNLTGSPYIGVDPATRQQLETFAFDQTGNWNHTSHTAPSWLDQTRTHNTANQITSFTNPSGVIQPTYDAAGNMTTMPRPGEWDTPFYCTWDAWNRLVKVRYPASSSSTSDSSGSSESSWSDSSSSESSWSDSSCSDSSCSDSSGSDSSESYSSSSELPSSSSAEPYEECIYHYDAITRRIRTSAGGETRDIYFNKQWRAIEERVADEVKAQYIWNPADRWDLLCRKRSVSGVLDEIRFVLRDYLDPVAIINESAIVTERYRYDAFGPVSILTEEFSPRTTSECDWNFLYHAEFQDPVTGLYNYAYRYYAPNLGRWISRDPIGEDGGLNLYGFCIQNSVNHVDVLGEQLFPGQMNENPLSDFFGSGNAVDTEQRNLFKELPENKDLLEEDNEFNPSTNSLRNASFYKSDQDGLAMYQCRKVGFGGDCCCHNGVCNWWFLVQYDCVREGFPIVNSPPLQLRISLEIEGRGESCPDISKEYPSNFRRLMGPINNFNDNYIPGMVPSRGPGYTQNE